MNTAARPRHIFLCADDYGISPGVSQAIRELIEQGRINATSVMMVAPALAQDDIDALTRHSSVCAIGLHVTLSAPFRPLTGARSGRSRGGFPPFQSLLRASLLRLLDRGPLREEIGAQIKAFSEAFGRPPDFVDGHQHVQIFPQIASAFVEAVSAAAPNAWVRQCGRAQMRSLRPRPTLKARLEPKALVLDVLSAGFRRVAAASHLRFNPAFAGAYDFTRDADFAALMGSFLRGLPEHSVVMCHPGFVDPVLTGLDPMTASRTREHTFLAGDEFPRLLAQNSVTLQGPSWPEFEFLTPHAEN
ncbi:MAG: ChbG/HpnK family deacetylase [Alphaproteobacteria bacterium]|nr:ChbG/HpnK family deacetylase [Alphaproteobacteria bacterium]